MSKDSPLRLIENPERDLPAMLTVPEVANYLGVGDSVVYEAVRQGMPFLRMGRLIRIPRAELLVWQRETAKRNISNPETGGMAYEGK